MSEPSTSIPLELANLGRLDAGIGVPRYRRDDIKAGIAHIGVGNFHRAHQAVYLDELFSQGLGREFGILGVGMRPHDRDMQARLKKQDWLTTVAEMDASGRRFKVTGAMIDYLPVANDKSAIVSALGHPDIRIVSMTITEGGYCIDAATGRFDPSHPEIAHDIAKPQSPISVFGILVASLAARRAAGITPFSVMSCDNISHNGDLTRSVVVGLAEAIDAELARWIAAEVAFPNSMVDRVTPFLTDQRRRDVERWTGIDDACPVICEPFRQWVIEDRFCNGRPPLEEVGVQFSDQVGAFELMKLRILNGGHAALAYPAALLDIESVHEGVTHPLIERYLHRLIGEEVIPTVPPVPGTDLWDYFTTVLARFSNPEVADTIARLCCDGSDRQPKFILPAMRARIAQGGGIDGLALETALWCRYCQGHSQSGRPIDLVDSRAARLREAANRSAQDPDAFLAITEVFGDLGTHEGYRQAFGSWTKRMHAQGVEATLKAYAGGSQA